MSFLKTLFSVPVLLIVGLCLVFFALYYRRLLVAKMLVISLILCLYLLCTPLMMQCLFAIIGRYPPLTVAQIQQQKQLQAIVILGGGFYQGKEFSQVQAGWSSLARVLYGAYVAKETQLAVAVSGIEGQGMRNTLLALGVQPQFVEDRSLDTYQNAQFSAQLLQKQGIYHIALVTDAWHMSRSVSAFEHFGFKVLAAPTEFPEDGFKKMPALWSPSAIMFNANLRGIAEVLGMVKYRVRYYLESQ